MGALAKNLLAIEYIFTSPCEPIDPSKPVLSGEKKSIKLTETGINFAFK